MAVEANGTSRAGSVRSGRRRPVRRAPSPARTVRPRACTSSVAVRSGAVEPVEQIRELAREDLSAFVVMWARTADPVLREHLRGLVQRAKRREDLAAGAVGFLYGPVAALEHAEAVCDWDTLADLRVFTSGRRIAGELIPLLDVIRGAGGAPPSFGAIAQAQQKLRAWFDAHGEDLLRPVVLAEVGRELRAPTLRREYDRWTAFAQQAAS